MYKQYLLGSHLSAAIPVIDSLIQQATVYAAQNGYFPNAQQLGYTTSGDYVDFTVSESWGPEFTNSTCYSQSVGACGNVAIFDVSGLGADLVTDNSYPTNPSANTPCGQYGTINGWFDPVAIGLGSYSSAADAGFECVLWHYNGTIQNGCVYFLYDGKNSVVGSIVPGWTNYNDTTAKDGSVIPWKNLTSFQNATCQ